ncbi:hypothetical protein NA56DRAFT_698496 [Hyaloscypha hepaticicola]|uniref:Uncharacterized protein n=1 Tax=Hyaloscypha hepaticicola TaxID=2082293 RepID=A0A2J6QJ79_9HELO|nr:hypothetical protein NA56DRAFT_698496 [Hyaloscypha hepaticicola]
MSSTYPSSNHATNGSVNELILLCDDGLVIEVRCPFALPKLSFQMYAKSNNIFHRSASASTNASPYASTAAEQQVLSTSRTAAYFTDTTTSHIQHRHRSAEQSVASHTANMRAYLDAFNAALATFEKSLVNSPPATSVNTDRSPQVPVIPHLRHLVTVHQVASTSLRPSLFPIISPLTSQTVNYFPSIHRLSTHLLPPYSPLQLLLLPPSSRNYSPFPCGRIARQVFTLISPISASSPSSHQPIPKHLSLLNDEEPPTSFGVLKLNGHALRPRPSVLEEESSIRLVDIRAESRMHSKNRGVSASPHFIKTLFASVKVQVNPHRQNRV